MERPKRQLKRLQEKVALKVSRSKKKKPGKLTKRYRKWVEQYKALIEGTSASSA